MGRTPADADDLPSGAGLGVSPALLLPSVEDVPTALPREASAAFDWDPFHEQVLRQLQQGQG